LSDRLPPGAGARVSGSLGSAGAPVGSNRVHSGKPPDWKTRYYFLAVKDLRRQPVSNRGLVQTWVTLLRRLALRCVARKPSTDKACGQDSTAIRRGMCYPGSGRLEPGPNRQVG